MIKHYYAAYYYYGLGHGDPKYYAFVDKAGRYAFIEGRNAHGEIVAREATRKEVERAMGKGFIISLEEVFRKSDPIFCWTAED